MKTCKQCNIEKDVLDFRHQTRGDKIHVSLVCKNCDQQNGKERHLKFRQKNRDKLRETNREYYVQNKGKIKERQKDLKKIWDKNYYEKNKNKIRKKQVILYKKKYHEDPNFRIRAVVSKSIGRALRASGSSKNRKSCLNFIPNTIKEIKKHLEKQFEPWMTWQNYGRYDAKNWDDNINTWTWQIDHIIPQTSLPYSTMTEENFRKCWSLENLRPLSAKQNLIEGVTRIRHGSKKWS